VGACFSRLFFFLKPPIFTRVDRRKNRPGPGWRRPVPAGQRQHLHDDDSQKIKSNDQLLSCWSEILSKEFRCIADSTDKIAQTDERPGITDQGCSPVSWALAKFVRAASYAGALVGSQQCTKPYWGSLNRDVIYPLHNRRLDLLYALVKFVRRNPPTGCPTDHPSTNIIGYGRLFLRCQ
jgi:hypothetical protein